MAPPGKGRDQRIARCDQERAVLQGENDCRSSGAWRRERIALQMDGTRPDLEDHDRRDRQQKCLGALRDHVSDALMKSNNSRRNARNCGFSCVVN
jgi:hypothetical protein